MLPIILAIRDENDKNFVEEIYIRYKENLLKKAKEYLRSEHDIEECIQDVFIIFIDHVEESYEWDEKHIKNFLMKCTRSVAINKYNSNVRRYSKEFSLNEFNAEGSFEVPDNQESIEQLVISEENVSRIAKILEEMDPMYGDILYFKSFLRMKNTEIAKTLNIPVNTVNQRVSRARKLLLKEGGEEINEILRK